MNLFECNLRSFDDECVGQRMQMEKLKLNDIAVGQTTNRLRACQHQMPTHARNLDQIQSQIIFFDLAFFPVFVRAMEYVSVLFLLTYTILGFDK